MEIKEEDFQIVKKKEVLPLLGILGIVTVVAVLATTLLKKKK
jgi:hypothetical protein